MTLATEVKKCGIYIFVSTLCIFTAAPMDNNLAVASDPPVSQTMAEAPKAVVAERAFTFDEVLEGEVVTHAFIIENQGTAWLKVRDVHTSCGCTMAQRPEAIAPGTSGQILVKGDTNGYGGGFFNKTITVTTNDAIQPRIRLRLNGPVAVFARIEPSRISLLGEAGEDLQAETSISPDPRYPFHIVKIIPDAPLADKIDAYMEQRKGSYSIVVRNRMAQPGQYRGRIVLKTDSARRPQLTLFVIGRITAQSN
ncbi:DUF1573 domain-containing protein [uncultured Desulfosarcina sp.]|uniref:DUF1573 domain-containing protein n=1 Tax=uncultured Desulfosarcina sp. TaxID=218289 RepID=UPI0029C675A7|nr:DUF1573 domain-containing protein [uncultured Desulfosarcina sp.]